MKSAKVYSVPRRYDLATLFTISLAFALLFGLLRALDATPVVFACIGGFVAAVGIGQAVLFRGRAPRIASIATGAAFLLTFDIVIYFVFIKANGRWGLIEVVLSAAFMSVWGSIFGYIAGALIGGVFLVADAIRRTVRKNAPHPKEPDVSS
ncbi:MAG: hypothetical protein FJ276_05920 [Planctomycetes bacterium]|nr:hypothetical protein [Planctomycetota bacterium]